MSKKHSRKGSELIGKTIHRIGSFPKQLSKSCPADIEGIDCSDQEDNNNATFTESLSTSYDRSVGKLSWLSGVFSKFGAKASPKCDHTCKNDVENHPFKFPFDKYSKERKIILFSNNLYKLEDEFHKLKDVEVLHLTKDIFYSQVAQGISNLPHSFGQLSGTLTELDLRGNLLKEFPNVICELSLLQILNLVGCEILSIPEDIKNLTCLRKLYLDNNKIVKPENLSLPKLEHLYLQNNGITSVSGIELMKLSMIDLSDNFITELPNDFLEGCVLKRLILSGNSLETLPDSICDLTTLRYLEVSKNILKRLPENIGNISNLKHLNISWNDLTALPESIVNLHQLVKDHFYCGKNPLQKPPYEVAVKGYDSIAAYFKALNSGTPNINSKRLKLMILGNERAGKTTLAKAIHLCIEPDSVEERTIGIDFFQWKAEAKENGLQVLLVDCAGQKKYIFTHQLFMSTGLLFAVVVNLKNYESANYDDEIGEWIQLIVARVSKAVVLIVPTCIDLCDVDEVKTKCDDILHNINKQRHEIRKTMIDEDVSGGGGGGSCGGSRTPDEEKKLLSSQQQKEMPRLPTHYKMSEDGEVKTYAMESGDLSSTNNDTEDIQLCMVPVSNKKHLEGLKTLREEVVRIANDKTLFPNINHVLPQSWVQLEERCMEERLHHKTIHVDELFDKVPSLFDTKDSMIEALQYIDSVGPIMYFNSIANLRDTVFLDPKWLMKAFKLVFRHDSEKYFTYKTEYEKIYDFDWDFEKDKTNLLNTALLSEKFLKCIWLSEFSEPKYFDQVMTLMKNFDLAIDLKTSRLVNTSNDKYMLVPWFLRDKLHDIDHEFKKSSIICQVQTTSILPDGFFQRLIVKVYDLFLDCFPWASGFLGIKKGYEIRCMHEQCGKRSYITFEGYPEHESEVYHMWEVIVPLLLTIKNFIKEWEGIKYETISICPTCYVKKKRELPQFWKLNLDALHDNQQDDVISCRLECKTVDKWLIYPPPAFAAMSQGIETNPQLDDKLSQPLSREQCDRVSGVVSNRCPELRRALSVHEGSLEAVHSQTNWRERCVCILQIWNSSNEEPTIRKFLQCVHKMKPYPHEIAEICIG